MRLGIMLGYAAGTMRLPIELVQEADRLGVYALWTAEAYGSDAISPLAWLGALTKNVHLGTAIMQMPARTPANAAMTAMTMQQLSGGRFLMGLGASGPQVVEGWHGVSYAKPLTRTREYIEIVRMVFERKERLAYQGQFYHLPYDGSDATGLGKPLKSTLDATPDIPIYLAAIGPKNVALA
ncbi:MAG: LLM class flavin-dependent oxidoreductase, partial [Chloroflexota bacterium]